MDKKLKYSELVAARKRCTLCVSNDFLNPASDGLGQFDSEHIGPWTRWLGDLDARLLIVGQEWGDTAAFLNQKGLDLVSSATNQRLRELLALIGLSVPPVGEHFNSGSSEVFLTNAALCLKRGGCQAAVKAMWFENCGSKFLRPQIELVNPKVVLTLGEHAYRAVSRSFHLPTQQFRNAVEQPPSSLPNGSLLVPVYHCGRRIRNTHRPDAEQEKDWLRVKQALEI